MNNDRPRTNNSIVTNSHSSSYDTVVTNIDVLANIYFFSNFSTIALF